MRWTRWHRAPVLLLHLLVVGLAPLADALAGTAAAEARVVHVESRALGGCAPAHDHLRCQICRVIAYGALGGDRALRTLERAGEPPCSGFAVHQVLPRRPLASSLGSRAPPLV